ncbi:hypothetical protein GCM10029978_047660 [Actinoallomurus acanthiterrae]
MHIHPVGADTYAVELTDPQGLSVASVASLSVRPIPADRLAAPRPAHHGHLLRLGWVPAGDRGAPVPAGDRGAPVPAATLDCADVPRTGSVPADVRAVTAHVLDRIQEHTAADGPADAPLLVVTHGAVVTGPGEPVTDLAGAAVWGLVRSAQSEHPGRIVIVDADAPFDPAALPSGEPQLALRDGRALTPRLAPAADATATDATGPAYGTGTVLVTGGTGTLGGLVARHLVAAHGVRHLLLASRQGADAPGAADLAAELDRSGARVTVAACDVADRGALADLLAGIDPARPLTGIVHTAGALDDGLISALTPDRLDAVLAAKADAAWHLHELTAGHDLAAFVLFSSAAGVLGRAGQGNYAAANAVLDALAQHRRANGLPAHSLAWGLWGPASGLTERLSAADRRAMAGEGVRALSTGEALELLDRAVATAEPAWVPVGLDLAARNAAEPLPPVLRDLAPAARRVAARTGGPSDLRERLSRLAPEERERTLLELVREHVAAVLGFDSPARADARRPFQDLGFDSLSAVRLRNGLNAETGLRLPATLVFDHPTPAAVAGYLSTELAPDGDAPDPSAILTGLRRLESQLAAAELDEMTNAAVARQLRDLLDRVGDGTGPADAGHAERLAVATDDEIFELIDRRLGRVGTDAGPAQPSDG